MTGAWRLACPEDHRTIQRVGNSTHSDCPPAFRCRTCREKYPEVTDLKTGQTVTP